MLVALGRVSLALCPGNAVEMALTVKALIIGWATPWSMGVGELAQRRGILHLP